MGGAYVADTQRERESYTHRVGFKVVETRKVGAIHVERERECGRFCIIFKWKQLTSVADIYIHIARARGACARARERERVNFAG